MPHRLIAIVNHSWASAFDIVTLGFLAGIQGFNAFISTEDWNKITGPHGLVFVLIIALTVIWTKSVRDDASRERRHREGIAAQEQHFAALLDLNSRTANDLKVLTVAATKAQINSANAVMSMDRHITKLSEEISETCRVNKEQIALHQAIYKQHN